jgi:aspartate carbamoyltransferase catalytic subunit
MNTYTQEEVDNLLDRNTSEVTAQILKNMSGKYLILSGEGNHETEYQFLMECSTLEDADNYFEKFKSGRYANTTLYIYHAKLIREL